MRRVASAVRSLLQKSLFVLGVTALVAASCGGTGAPRTAVQVPREASGPSDSPAVQRAFAVQGELDLPESQSTMQRFLGSRFAGDWIANNGKTGVLYVGVVHLVDADQRFARSHVHMGPDASVKLVNERYSMTRLEEFNTVVGQYIESHTKGNELERHTFDSFGPSPPDNAVELTVSREDAKFWIPRIQPLLPYNAFVIRYSSRRAATALEAG